jgi:RNA polymerase sigma-70 factor (ECF subfamily)
MATGGLKSLEREIPRSRSRGFTHRRSEASDAQDRLRAAIARAKEGDIDALHYIYVRFADDVFAYVRRIVRDSHDAEDITQTMFAKLMTAIVRYEEREVPFSAWVLRVARNAALDHLRARRHIPYEEVQGIDKHDELGALERSRSLGTALDQLPPDQRQVLVLRHISGLSPGEIAQRIGKTESSVHGLHHRGRKAMCEALLELESGPTTLSS